MASTAFFSPLLFPVTQQEFLNILFVILPQRKYFLKNTTETEYFYKTEGAGSPKRMHSSIKHPAATQMFYHPKY